MSLGPGPYFLSLFGIVDTPIPLATSPVAKYKAPNAESSWTALGIHGYVQKYNEQLAVINDLIVNTYGAAAILNKLSPTNYMYSTAKDTLESLRWRGINACIEYNNHLAWSQDSLVAGCRQLGVSLPMHGKTEGMKPVYAVGMDLPKGSYPLKE